MLRSISVYFGNALGNIATEQHLASIVSLKDKVSISKVGPIWSGIILVGPTCTKNIKNNHCQSINERL